MSAAKPPPRPSKLTPRQSFMQIGLPMLAFLLAGSVLLANMSDPWLKRMDRLQGRSEADIPKKQEPAAAAPTPPKRKFDMEEEWKKMEPQLDLNSWALKRIPRPPNQPPPQSP